MSALTIQEIWPYLNEKSVYKIVYCILDAFEINPTMAGMRRKGSLTCFVQPKDIIEEQRFYYFAADIVLYDLERGFDLFFADVPLMHKIFEGYSIYRSSIAHPPPDATGTFTNFVEALIAATYRSGTHGSVAGEIIIKMLDSVMIENITDGSRENIRTGIDLEYVKYAEYR